MHARIGLSPAVIAIKRTAVFVFSIDFIQEYEIKQLSISCGSGNMISYQMHCIVQNTLFRACRTLLTAPNVPLRVSTPDRVLLKHPFSSPGLTHTIPKDTIWGYMSSSQQNTGIFFKPLKLIPLTNTTG